MGVISDIRNMIDGVRLAMGTTSVLRIEIERVGRAVRRGEQELDEIYRTWRETDPYGCCPGCATGGRYTALCDKQDRRRFWLDRLEAKFKRDGGSES